jgi:signal transduction histidine kinase
MAETTYDRPDGGDLGAMALARQRTITERLLLAALDARDASSEAIVASQRAAFLAATSRDLAISLDGAGAREAIRRRTLMRDGSWCIVDMVEQDGAVHRLSVVHPDASKQDLAEHFADRWFPIQADVTGDASPARIVDGKQTQGYAALRDLGFGGLLVVPLVVRSTVLGAITFVTREDDPPFSPEEITLASDLADLCAIALDNERLYQQAHTLRKTADAANHAKSVFLGTMTHELMTPLNAIGGYVTLLEMGLRGPVSAEQIVDLGRIRHNQVHLLALISDVLTFVRTEHGGLEYNCTAVSAQAALQEVTNMLHGTAEERGLVLATPRDPADTMMWADAERVRQILLNLVMNAVKYATAAEGKITLSVSSTFDTVALHVDDDGPGIPEDRLQDIFEPFVQLATSHADRRGGVGLGLAISRDLARGMSGTLTVVSTVGVGSRFTLELPRAPRRA